MSLRIIRNDITRVRADAIINTANPLPRIGTGTDSAVYQAAGKEKLLEAREKIGIIDRGQAVMTPAFDLTEKNGVKYIIHTVGITYVDGTHGERTILRSCYSNSLKIARRLGCKSIATPLLASGNYGFPKGMALDIAIDEINDFLSEHEMEVILVVYDEESFTLSEQLEKGIESFIDQNYIEDNQENEEQLTYSDADVHGKAASTSEQLKNLPERKDGTAIRGKEKLKITPIDVNAFVEEKHQGSDFKDMLLKIIADKNLANKDVYKKTSITTKYFSKIISPKNPYYPKKDAVLQLGLALELDIDEFRKFLAAADYAFNPHSRRDLVIQYCVMNGIYEITRVDAILLKMKLPCLDDTWNEKVSLPVRQVKK